MPQWRFGATGSRGPPDRLVLDLDPGPGVGLAECAVVALRLRDLLEGIGMTAVPVTSGSKGMHLYAPLDGEVDLRRAPAPGPRDRPHPRGAPTRAWSPAR